MAAALETAKRLKRGVRFLHRHYLDQKQRPLVCTVTRVYLTIVYWKQDGEKKAHNYFYLEDADKYVKEFL